MMDLRDIRQALARGYCHAENEKKELDAHLIEAMAQEVMEVLQQGIAKPADASDSGAH